MANDRSPESVGERAMFAPDAAPFTLPPRADGAPVTAAGFRPWLRFRSASERLTRARVDGVASGDLGIRPLSAKRPACPSRAAAARAVRFAVSTELDRGIAFILAPVFLAAGALIYFALGREPASCRSSPAAIALGVLAFAERRAAGPPHGACRRAALRSRRAVRQGRDLARRYKNARRRGDDAAFRPRRRGRASRQRPRAADHRRDRHASARSCATRPTASASRRGTFRRVSGQGRR